MAIRSRPSAARPRGDRGRSWAVGREPGPGRPELDRRPDLRPSKAGPSGPGPRRPAVEPAVWPGPRFGPMALRPGGPRLSPPPAELDGRPSLVLLFDLNDDKVEKQK